MTVMFATACSSLEKIPKPDSGVAPETGDAGVVLDAANPVPDVGGLPAECESQVRFSLSGLITSVRVPWRIDRRRVWAERLNGQSISAVIGFDPTVSDSREVGDYGRYRQPPENSEMTLETAVIEQNFTRPSSLFVEPINDLLETGDRLSFVGNFDDANGPMELQAEVVCRDASGLAIDGIESPGTLPRLAVWGDGCTIRITGGGGRDPFEEERLEACRNMGGTVFASSSRRLL